MNQTAKPLRYSVHQINGVMNDLRASYDVVRLVNVSECRVVDVQPDGNIKYLQECFSIWGRGGRCKNCTSFRACSMHRAVDKQEFLGDDREDIHSIPIELIMLNGEPQDFVIECVRFAAHDKA